MVNRIDPWYRRAALRHDNVKRVRACVKCGKTRDTVEFARLMPRPQSTPRRCPKCITHLGVVVTMQYIDHKYSYVHKEARNVGAIVRRRECKGCGASWHTYETLPGATRCRDVSRCECSNRMAVVKGKTTGGV